MKVPESSHQAVFLAGTNILGHYFVLKCLPVQCDSKNCYKKQLIDGANDLHAWNIEDVCTCE